MRSRKEQNLSILKEAGVRRELAKIREENAAFDRVMKRDRTHELLMGRAGGGLVGGR